MDLKALQDGIDKLTAEVADTVKFATDENPLTQDQLDANAAKLAEVEALKAKQEEARLLATPQFTADAPSESDVILNTNQKTGKVTMNQEPNFTAELSAWLGGKDVEFTAITVAGNTATVPVGATFANPVRKNGNVFRAILAATGYAVESLPYVQNWKITVLGFADGAVGAENGSNVDVTPTPVTVSLDPALVTSETVWLSEGVVKGPAFKLDNQLPGLLKAVERKEESLAFAVLKAKAIADATLIGVTTQDDASITYEEFTAWKNSMIQAYYADAVYVVSSTLKAALESVVDESGRPILTSGTDGIYRIDGKPVFVSDSFEAMGVSKYVGAIISPDSIKMVEAGEEFKRYVDNPDHKAAVGLEIYRFSDTDFIPYGIKFLKTGTGGT